MKQEEKKIELRYISLNNNTQERGGRRRRRGRGRQGSDTPLKKAKTQKVKEKVNRRPFAGYGNNNKKDNVL